MSASTSRAWLEHYSDWTPHTLDYGDKTIVDYYRNNLRVNGNKSATYFFGRTQTYAELDAQVRAAAAGERLDAFVVRKAQKQHGLRVVAEASDGAEAYRLFKEVRPDLVIMDLTMPGVGGIETSTGASPPSARKPTTPVLKSPA